jgi:hypothetical protein
MQDHELRRMEPPLTWDHTMRSTRKQCIRKLYFFLRRFDYDSQNTPSYFVYGRAFGAGLRKWYDTPYAAAETQEGQRRAAVAVADALSQAQASSLLQKMAEGTLVRRTCWRRSRLAVAATRHFLLPRR